MCAPYRVCSHTPIFTLLASDANFLVLNCGLDPNWTYLNSKLGFGFRVLTWTGQLVPFVVWHTLEPLQMGSEWVQTVKLEFF